jgi:subtilisin family serine protease
MPDSQAHDCLEGVLVRADDLPVGHDGAVRRVEVLRTATEHRFVATWTSPSPTGPDIAHWAIATSLLVTLRRDVSEAAKGRILEPLFPEDSVTFQELPLPGTILIESRGDLLHAEGRPTFPLALLPELRRRGEVLSATPEYLYFTVPLAVTSNESLRQIRTQPELELIRATEFWGPGSFGDRAVAVAVLDTGIDVEHPDLAANILRDASNAVVGCSFIGAKADVSDSPRGHGTFCAGLIGAQRGSGIGVYPDVKLIPIKFLGSSGCGKLSDAIQGIDFALRAGAKVISNSWGGASDAPELRAAVERAHEQGVLFVAGAGNYATDLDSQPFYPGAFDVPNVICVGASDDADRPMLKWGHARRCVHLCAPGHSIYSTLPTPHYAYPYGESFGTSASTAFVAGACALVIANDPRLSHIEVRRQVIQSVVPLKGNRREVALACCSGGRLDVAKAVHGTGLNARLRC